MTRRPKTSLASPAELELLVRGLSLDALAIVPMYKRLHAMGGEGERGETVHVSGGGVGDPTGTTAVDNERAKHYREYAVYVAAEIGRLARKADRLRQGLEHNVGPGPGFRQSQTLGSDAIVSIEQFHESLENQAARLRQGGE